MFSFSTDLSCLVHVCWSSVGMKGGEGGGEDMRGDGLVVVRMGGIDNNPKMCNPHEELSTGS